MALTPERHRPEKDQSQVPEAHCDVKSEGEAVYPMCMIGCVTSLAGCEWTRSSRTALRLKLDLA